MNKKDPWKIAIEFRNPTWYDETVYQTLNKYKATVVIHDLPGKASLVPEYLTTPFKYIRFHGTEKSYRGSYSVEFLEEYAQKINHCINQGIEVYVYFNNTMGDALRNLEELNGLLKIKR